MNTTEQQRTRLAQEIRRASDALVEIKNELWDKRKDANELLRANLCHITGRIDGVASSLRNVVAESDRLTKEGK